MSQQKTTSPVFEPTVEYLFQDADETVPLLLVAQSSVKSSPEQEDQFGFEFSGPKTNTETSVELSFEFAETI